MYNVEVVLHNGMTFKEPHDNHDGALEAYDEVVNVVADLTNEIKWLAFDDGVIKTREISAVFIKKESK